jgi:hypothetical protein
MGKKLHHMYHACRITVKFNGSRNFSEIFAKIFAKTKIFAKRNFAKIVPFSHDFCIFSKIEKCIFVSTLALELKFENEIPVPYNYDLS